MKKLMLVKAIGDVIVSLGVGSIVSGAIRMVPLARAGKFTKFCAGVGSFVLTSMAIDKASKYTTDGIQAIADAMLNGVPKIIVEEKTDLDS